MTALTSRLELLVSGTLSAALDLTSAAAPLSIRRVLEFANGSGARQANLIWSDQRTLGPSASENLDLAGGGLVDAFGVAFAPARLRGVVIYSATANLNNLTLFGNAASVPILNTPATTYTLQPGGFFVATFPATAGAVVTPTTADIIQVANAAGVNSVTYDIVLLGCSA